MVFLHLLLAAQAGTPAPLHKANAVCANHRFPALAGPWVVTCDKRQRIARAVSVEGHAEHSFEPTSHAGTGFGQILLPGHGLYRFGQDGDASPIPIPASALHPVTNGTNLAWVSTDQQVHWTQDGQKPHVIETSKARIGTQPAATHAGVGWVADSANQDADLWWYDATTSTSSILDGGAGDQHHPIADGPWLMWVSDGDIHLWNTETHARQHIPTETGFNASPTLSNGVACWETRRERHQSRDIDIVCSDGVHVDMPGHQTHPQRWGRHLLFRDQGQLMLLSQEEQP